MASQSFSSDPLLSPDIAVLDAKSAQRRREKRKLWLAVVFVTLFFAVELSGGLIASSLAILSDAFHLLTDLISFGISLLALYISAWPPSKRKFIEECTNLQQDFHLDSTVWRFWAPCCRLY
jgi:Co/Zn/Cd efflux system component